MQSKTSLFNRGLFRSTISRFWPLWVAYLLTLFVMTPMSLFSVDSQSYYLVTSGLLRTAWQGGAIVSFVMAVATAMCVFGFLYSTRSTSMIASLPIKRETVFISVSSAGLVMMLGADLLIFLISLLLEVGAGVVSMSHLWSWLGAIVLMNISFYGFAVFCAMLTGNLVVLPLVYALLQVTVAAVENLIHNILSTFVFGLSTSGYFLESLSPIVKLLSSGVPDYYYSYSYSVSDSAATAATFSWANWRLLIIYGISGIVFTVLALLLFRKRKMETSTDVVAISVLKPVFKYCLCIGCALVAGVGLYSIIFTISYSNNSYLFMGIFMIIGAFIGYFAAEMLIKKTLRVFTFKCRGLYIVFGLILACLLAFSTDVFGFETKVPKLDEIESVTVSSSELVELRETENIELALELHQKVISDKAIHGNLGDNWRWIDFDYVLKDGSTLRRQYRVADYTTTADSETSEVLMLQELLNTTEATAYRKNTSVEVKPENINYASIGYYDESTGNYESVTLSSEQAYELYTQCILPDIDAGGLGRIWLVTDEEYYDTVYQVSINIDLSDRSINPDGTYNYSYDYFSTTLTTKAINTLAWLTANTDITPVLEEAVPSEPATETVERAATLSPMAVSEG